MDTTVTSCTRHSWAYRGRWWCRKASWSPCDHFKTIYLWKIVQKKYMICQFFGEYKWFFHELLPMVELIDVLESSDHLGTQIVFFLKICSWNMFQIIIFGRGQPTCPTPVDWIWGRHRGTWSRNNDLKIFQLDFLYGLWHAKFHWPNSKIKTKRTPPPQSYSKMPGN